MKARIRRLYVHIPFCPTKCSYCAFVTHVGSLKMLPAYVRALIADAESEAATSSPGPLDTVYFGGGTPSMMEPEQVRTLLAHFESLFGLSKGCEITLEAHPATVHHDKLDGFRAAGVTRISLGAESLQATELESVGRRYHPDLVPAVAHMCRAAGFESVAMDLIYGLPGQSIDSWHDTLRQAVRTSVDHLSLYPLSIEPGTVFSRRWREGGLHVPPDEAVVEMYDLACGVLRHAGFTHYEVANWAKPGALCRHNLAYWLNREFCAIGVGAHGYIKPYRTERLVGTKRYIDVIGEAGDPVVRREYIDRKTELRETVMLRLRLLQHGLDLTELAEHFGVDACSARASTFEELAARGMILVGDNTVRLAESAVPVANEVWASLM